MSDFLAGPIENQSKEESKKEDSIFLELLGSISENKNDLSSHERFEKDYSPYNINSYFSRFIDTVVIANLLNRYNIMSKKSHYRYLLNTVKKNRRREKNSKSDTSNLDMVALYYDFSLPKAAKALAILSEENLNVIKQKLNKGGTRNVS